MPVCIKCATDKTPQAFSKSAKYASGLNSVCKACASEYSTAYYAKHGNKYKANADAARLRIVETIREAKDVPCHDCGQRYHYCVMDLDHRPGEVKLFNFGHYPHSLKQVLAELAKCDPVCANCHRLRTWARANPDV